MSDDSDEKPEGKLVSFPGGGGTSPPSAQVAAPRVPTEAAAFLAERLAEGGVNAVYLIVFHPDGRFERALFGTLQLQTLGWAAEYMIRDAMNMSDQLSPPIMGPGGGKK